MRKLCLLAAAVMMTSCASVEQKGYGDLSLQPIEPLANELIPQVSVDTLIEGYEFIVDQSAGNDNQALAQYRLAALHLKAYDDDTADSRNLSKAIHLLEDLADQLISWKRHDEVLYQLARAQAKANDAIAMKASFQRLLAEHKDSAFAREAAYRLGVLYFNDKEYTLASQAFLYLVENSQNHYALHGSYRRAWSQLKSGLVLKATDSFIATLDQLAQRSPTLNQLPEPQKSIADDSLMAVGLMVVQQITLGGKSSPIDGLLQRLSTLENKPYAFRLYDSVATQLVKRGQIDKAVGLYQGFIQANPNSLHTPLFHSRVIDLHAVHGNKALVLQEQQSFVQDYGVSSDYWPTTTVEQRHWLLEPLGRYMLALAGYYEAKAESTNDPDYYNKAAKQYSDFLASLPDHEKRFEIQLSWARSLAKGGDIPLAISTLESIAYGEEVSEISADAGYEALLAYPVLIASFDGNDKKQHHWQSKMAHSQLWFIRHFPLDSRIKRLQLDTAKRFNELHQPDMAESTIKPLLNRLKQNSAEDPELLWQSWWVYGVSLIQQSEFEDARKALNEGLKLAPEDMALQDAMAQALHHEAGLLVADEEHQDAINLYQQLISQYADSQWMDHALFEISAIYAQLGSHSETIKYLQRFNTLYPDHPIQLAAAVELVAAYESLDQWQQAAGTWLVISKQSSSEHTRRIALLSAAKSFKKSDQLGLAKKYFQDYIQQFPRPILSAQQTRLELASIARQQGQQKEGRQWLSQLLDAQPRSLKAEKDKVALADLNKVVAGAAMELALFEEALFLSQLNKTQKVNRAQLKKTRGYLQKAASFQLPEYTAQATYKLASLYVALMNNTQDRDQTFLYKQQAIEVHTTNKLRVKQGINNQWVEKSIQALSQLIPAHQLKQEMAGAIREDIK